MLSINVVCELEILQMWSSMHLHFEIQRIECKYVEIEKQSSQLCCLSSKMVAGSALCCVVGAQRRISAGTDVTFCYTLHTHCIHIFFLAVTIMTDDRC